MRRRPAIAVPTVALATAVLLTCGCTGAGVVSDNPVVGPAPPRMRVAKDSPKKTAQSTDIVNVGFETSSGDWSDVAARVNGLPIFVSDVLEQERPKLEVARQQMPPEVFVEQRDGLVIRKLAPHIEQQLILEAVKETLDPDQAEAVQGQLDGMFDQELERLKGVLKVNSLAELEAGLMREGTSISAIRRAFDSRTMASMYLGLKLQKVQSPTRADLMRRYEANVEDFTRPADVKWQQLWISHDANGGRDGAVGVLRQAVADLKAGETFDVVVGRYSDGAMKETGGIWDYVLRSSIANEETAAELFRLPPGEVSRPIDTGKAFQIVRVIDRRAERVVPFAEVQEDLAAALEEERRRALIADTVQELWTRAEIKTRYDDDQRWLAVLEARNEAAIAAASESEPN